MSKKLLTVAEYAKKTGIPAITIYKQVERKAIPHEIKYGRILIIAK
jgi:predicted DNA-binding transcriptional regulator AlpA